MKIRITTVCLVVAALIVGAFAQQDPATDDAIERARTQVRMLDDLYKAAVVLITTHYVSETSSLPAGTAAITLFEAMKKKGWHEVRLIDATGRPLIEKNTAQDDFEKAAVDALKGGESYYDRVVARDGKRYLRAATPLPMVLDKCATCHPHYQETPEGAPIGILGYTMPIE